MADVAAKVKKIIVDKLGVDESDVTPEASFTNDLGADSLDTVELIMEFEKEFDLSIPDEEAEKIEKEIEKKGNLPLFNPFLGNVWNNIHKFLKKFVDILF